MNIKEIIKKTPFFTAYSLFKVMLILEIKMGHLKSLLKQKCIDKNNNELPWYSYPAIDFINNLDLKDCSVFEFGSGYSTLFWSKISKSIVSVEANEKWYQKIKEDIKEDNVKLLFFDEPKGYTESITNESNDFDIIIIDGFWRFDCIDSAISKLSDRGFIIFDNSDWAKKSCKYLTDKGFTQIDFMGFAPSNNHRHSTSFFIRESSILNRKYKNGEIKFIGSIDLNLEE